MFVQSHFQRARHQAVTSNSLSSHHNHSFSHHHRHHANHQPQQKLHHKHHNQHNGDDSNHRDRSGPTKDGVALSSRRISSRPSATSNSSSPSAAKWQKGSHSLGSAIGDASDLKTIGPAVGDDDDDLRAERKSSSLSRECNGLQRGSPKKKGFVERSPTDLVPSLNVRVAESRRNLKNRPIGASLKAKERKTRFRSRSLGSCPIHLGARGSSLEEDTPQVGLLLSAHGTELFKATTRAGLPPGDWYRKVEEGAEIATPAASEPVGPPQHFWPQKSDHVTHNAKFSQVNYNNVNGANCRLLQYRIKPIDDEDFSTSPRFPPRASRQEIQPKSLSSSLRDRVSNLLKSIYTSGENLKLISSFCINFVAYQLETWRLLVGGATSIKLRARGLRPVACSCHQTTHLTDLERSPNETMDIRLVYSGPHPTADRIESYPLGARRMALADAHLSHAHLHSHRSPLPQYWSELNHSHRCQVQPSRSLSRDMDASQPSQRQALLRHTIDGPPSYNQEQQPHWPRLDRRRLASNTAASSPALVGNHHRSGWPEQLEQPYRWRQQQFRCGQLGHQDRASAGVMASQSTYNQQLYQSCDHQHQHQHQHDQSLPIYQRPPAPQRSSSSGHTNSPGHQRALVHEPTQRRPLKAMGSDSEIHKRNSKFASRTEGHYLLETDQRAYYIHLGRSNNLGPLQTARCPASGSQNRSSSGRTSQNGSVGNSAAEGSPYSKSSTSMTDGTTAPRVRVKLERAQISCSESTPAGSSKSSSGTSHKKLQATNSMGKVSLAGAKRRLGFKQKGLNSLSVHRSEEVIPSEMGQLLRFNSGTVSSSVNSSSMNDSHDENSSWLSSLLVPDPKVCFVEGLGFGQIASRQALVSPYLGDIQLSLSEQRGMLEVEVVRVRQLQPKAGAKRLPSPYVKVYLIKNKKCVAKFKTSQVKRTLDPFYQQRFIFRDDYSNSVLQAIVWADYGKKDRKSLMGVVQIHLSDLDISTVLVGWYKLFNVPSMANSMTMSSSSKTLRQTLSSTRLGQEEILTVREPA